MAQWRTTFDPAGQTVATIQKRVSGDGSTSYRAMVRLKGYPAQYATFKRKTDANRWAQETETAIRKGRYFKAHEAKRRTVAELIDRYNTEVLAPKSKQRRVDQERQLRWWREQIGDLFIADVTPALISELRGKLARGTTFYGRPRTPATVNRYTTSLSHVFSIAVREWEWAAENPLARVRKLTEPRGRVRFLSDDERKRLLEACQESTNRELYPLVVLALSTGARQGELLRLTWPDIDFERGVAIVHETKNQERRALPLQGRAREVLQDLKRVRRLGTDLVFAGKRTDAVVFPRSAWTNALRRAEVEDFRFHDLRHSAASYLAMNGATLAEIAEVLGHKTLAMVKRYAHLTEQHTSDVVARMNEQIFG